MLKIVALAVVSGFLLFGSGFVFGADKETAKTSKESTKTGNKTVEILDAAKESIIRGKIEKIAADSSFFIISGTKISTTKKFIDDAFLEEGDDVEIMVQKRNTDLKAVGYSYVFNEKDGSEDSTMQDDTTEEIEEGSSLEDEPKENIE